MTRSEWFSSLTRPSNKLLMLGLLIRLVPAAFTAHPTDMEAWRTIGSAIYNGQSPYILQAFGLVYPPLWGLVCAIAYAIYAPTQNTFVFNFVMKLPIIAADIAVAGTIETIVLTKTRDQRTAQKAMMLYLFNPMTVILSSFWGMFDAIPAFLVLLSMISLSRKQYVKSGLALGLGIAFKGVYPAFLLPLFIYAILKTEGKGKTLGYLASSMLVPVASTMPFLVANATSFVNLTVFHHLTGQLTNLTYWLLIHTVFPQSQETITTISLVVFITAFLSLYAYFLRKADPALAIRTMILIILAFFLTSPTVNEQYIVWLLPPMIIYAASERQKMKTYVYALTMIATFYVAVNTGPAFFLPIDSQLGQYQHLLPAMVIFGLMFSVTSIAALLQTKRENEEEMGNGRSQASGPGTGKNK